MNRRNKSAAFNTDASSGYIQNVRLKLVGNCNELASDQISKMSYALRVGGKVHSSCVRHISALCCGS